MDCELLRLLINSSFILFIAFIGWIVLFNNAKKISARNETFNLVNQTQSSIKEINTNSINFYSKLLAGNNEQPLILSDIHQIQLLAQFSIFRTLIKMLERRNITIPSTDIYHFRQAVTLQYRTDTTKDIKEKINKITTESAELINKIQTNFEDSHKSKANWF